MSNNFLTPVEPQAPLARATKRIKSAQLAHRDRGGLVRGRPLLGVRMRLCDVLSEVVDYPTLLWGCK